MAASIANTAVSLVIHEFLDSHPDVKDIEKASIDAKVTMKHFEEAVKKFISFDICIIDTGTGISKEGLSKLFLNFNKLEENADKNKGGTGLGLSICKQIIEQMGGSVNCTSEINNGTEFCISLSCPCYQSVHLSEMVDVQNDLIMHKPHKTASINILSNDLIEKQTPLFLKQNSDPRPKI